MERIVHGHNPRKPVLALQPFGSNPPVGLKANACRNLRMNLAIHQRRCGPSSPVMEPLGHAVASNSTSLARSARNLPSVGRYATHRGLYSKNSPTPIHRRSGCQTSGGRGAHSACPPSSRCQPTPLLPKRSRLTALHRPYPGSPYGRRKRSCAPPAHRGPRHRNGKNPSLLSSSHCVRHHP